MMTTDTARESSTPQPAAGYLILTAAAAALQGVLSMPHSI